LDKNEGNKAKKLNKIMQMRRVILIQRKIIKTKKEPT